MSHQIRLWGAVASHKYCNDRTTTYDQRNGDSYCFFLSTSLPDCLLNVLLNRCRLFVLNCIILWTKQNTQNKVLEWDGCHWTLPSTVFCPSSCPGSWEMIKSLLFLGRKLFCLILCTTLKHHCLLWHRWLCEQLSKLALFLLLYTAAFNYFELRLFPLWWLESPSW